ncbi:MAG: amino acid permease [Candidatus Norongarragalinales archaeon]
MRRIRLARDLGFWDSVLLGIGFIVGSGIFIMPVVAAQTAGSWSIFAWFAAGLYTILTGLCFAELAVRSPKAGGLYAYAHDVFGDFLGFFTGYSFWLGYWITIAVEMLALAWYLSFFTGLSFELRLAIAVFIGFVFTLINYKGVRLGSSTEDVLTVGKLVPLGILVVAGLASFNPSVFSAGFAAVNAGHIALAFLSSFILVLWAFQGVEIITVPQEEIKNAKKTVPKAIIVSVLSVMALYLLIALVVLGSVDWKNFAASESALADISEVLIGGWGGALLAIGGLVSILGALNAVILASARISFAMARDGLFPRLFEHLHGRHATPDYALILQFVFAALLVWLYRDFIFLASLAVFFTLIPWFLSCLAAWRVQLREHKHSILNHVAVPTLATVFTALLIVYLLPQYWPFALLSGILGLAYFSVKKREHRTRFHVRGEESKTLKP